jgi:hypothetical protein
MRTRPAVLPCAVLPCAVKQQLFERDSQRSSLQTQLARLQALAVAICYCL